MYDSVAHRIFGCTHKAKLSHQQAIEKSKKYGLYYYKCQFCGKYHLTKQPTYESIMEDTENE